MKTSFQLIINNVIKDQIEINYDDFVRAFWVFHERNKDLHFSINNIWKLK